MVHEHFDVEGLARYLNLDPAVIARMAERGKLPGRKIAGQWRFARAEIHHWLEDRIGASDQQQLMQVEGVLDQSGADARNSDAVSIADMLPLDAIAAPLRARTRASVISAMVQLAGDTGMLWDPSKMAEAVRARENLHPTALDNGIALLHPRRPLPNILADAFLALGVSPQGIPFGGGRGNLTDIFFLICSTTDRGHLRVLARLSRLIADGSLLDELRQAKNAQQIHQLIAERERNLKA